MLQSTLLDKWWRNHIKYEGEVHLVNCDWNLLDTPEKYIDELFGKYKNIPIEDVMKFVDSEVTDNEMQHREILEDGSKIQYLRNEIKTNGLNFLPSLLHEPWHDRYRIHPGSGRTAAMWLEGMKQFDAIYIHFNENHFAVPAQSNEIYNVKDFKDICSAKAEPFFETYFAFPKIATDCKHTLEMDREWQWHHTKTYRPWKFIRWSEGPEFLNYKRDWRSFALDLWSELQ